jgi:CcmD family protein
VSVEGYLALALAAVIVGIGGYVASLIIRRKRLESRRAELKSRSRDEGA